MNNYKKIKIGNFATFVPEINILRAPEHIARAAKNRAKKVAKPSFK
jgi:hypothetical protein